MERTNACNMPAPLCASLLASIHLCRMYRCALPRISTTSCNLPMVMKEDASDVPQIWGLVAGDNSALTKPQFYSSLRLISLAQASSNIVARLS